jgi:anhydro-N-acetylmuramic acid kinase
VSAQELFIGLMSGTSADSIDAALVAFDEERCLLLGTHSHPLTPNLKTEIHALSFTGDNEIARLGVLDNRLGHAFSDAVAALLVKAGKSAGEITAIGSPGQTIRHEPAHEGGVRFTLQIGDANIIAERTGILTVADFRRRDIACGGHGAPLAPAFHAGQFGSDTPRCIVNIGGIANITSLPTQGPVQGFDTGPGNTLLDAWIQQNRGETFDRDGAWAASGTVDASLLHTLLQHPFLERMPPKSTGREEFNLAWLQRVLNGHASNVVPADVQATLLEFTALTISNAIRAYCEAQGAVFICGGGAHNQQLMHRLKLNLPQQTVETTEVLGLHPDWVEAVAFAWLAKQHVHGLPGNLPSVTGADKAVILGAAFPP